MLFAGRANAVIASWILTNRPNTRVPPTRQDGTCEASPRRR